MDENKKNSKEWMCIKSNTVKFHKNFSEIYAH